MLFVHTSLNSANSLVSVLFDISAALLTPTVKQVQRVKQPANTLPAVRVITPPTALSAGSSAVSTPTVVASIVTTSAAQQTNVTASSPVSGAAAIAQSADPNNKLPIAKLRGQAKPKERKSSHNVIEKRCSCIIAIILLVMSYACCSFFESWSHQAVDLLTLTIRILQVNLRLLWAYILISWLSNFIINILYEAGKGFMWKLELCSH